MLKADKGLFKHWVFWLCVLGPIFLSLGLACWFGLFDLPFSPTLQGVENFYERGRFFLALAALAIPLGATFARMHASEQTAKLIKNADNFRKEDAFLKQREDFIEFLDLYVGRQTGYYNDLFFRKDAVGQPLISFYYFIGSSYYNEKEVEKTCMIIKKLQRTCGRFVETTLLDNFKELSAFDLAKKRVNLLAKIYAEVVSVNRDAGLPFKKVTYKTYTDDSPDMSIFYPRGKDVYRAQQEAVYDIYISVNNLALGCFYASQIAYSNNRDYSFFLNESCCFFNAVAILVRKFAAEEKYDQFQRDCYLEKENTRNQDVLYFWSDNTDFLGRMGEPLPYMILGRFRELLQEVE
ncbi:hypothetical protein ACW17M_04040 [Vreelandella sp. 2A-K22]